MAILTRYTVKMYLRNFALSLSSFAGIYLLIEFFEKVDNFVEKSAPIGLYFSYFLNAIPLFATQVAPLAILMAAFITVGGLSRTGELTAMRAGGLSLYRITRPLIITTCIITLLLLGTQELILPRSASTMNKILHQQIKGDSQPQRIRNKIWVRTGNSILHIEQAIPEDGTLQDISIIDLDENFQITTRTDAGSARFENNAWQFKNLKRRSFNPDSGEMIHSADEKQRQINLNKQPDDFKQANPQEWELSFLELRKLVNKMRAEGYDATRFQVDMHAHISTPFTCIVMALLGIPFALNRGRNTSLSFGIVVSVIVGVIYFILNSVTMAFGYSGILPPILATWSANILVGLTGLWLVLFRTE